MHKDGPGSLHGHIIILIRRGSQIPKSTSSKFSSSEARRRLEATGDEVKRSDESHSSPPESKVCPNGPFPHLDSGVALAGAEAILVSAKAIELIDGLVVLFDVR